VVLSSSHHNDGVKVARYGFYAVIKLNIIHDSFYNVYLSGVRYELH